VTVRPLFLAGEPLTTGATLAVTDKHSGEIVAEVALADGALVDRAIGVADEARDAMAAVPAWKRRDVLAHCARRFEERREELAGLLAVEAGKPIRDARGEVTRLVDTFRLASEEATRIGGEVMPLDVTPRATGWRGLWKRVPIGACGFVSPCNFPLNLVAHKVAPAIAAGCPFVLKPASSTPLGALVVGEVLAETDLPAGAFSILPARPADAERLATDPRLALFSFTGSPAVGWALRGKAGTKKVALELGGNAACIVCADADLDDAVARLVFGAFYQSGQSCISVQRILVDRRVHDALREKLVAAAPRLVAGDPREERTDLGPLISVAEAERVARWIDAAVARGARLLCGGSRDGAHVAPTLLEEVPRDEPVWCEEVFGPVACLAPFDTLDEALAIANDTAYGLQAGIFTRGLHAAMHAWDVLEVGGVIVGDVPSFRVDAMPYGGVKRSGTGREGVRFAIEEMTEIRMLALRDRPP
jgi:acyl-CoA reductase-like NAD-dependent aldehyde dehydrogenase